MKYFPGPNDSSSDEEFLVAPPFTTIGLSIPSISWLNEQLESDGDGPGMRGEKRGSQREQPQNTGDAPGHAITRAEAQFSTGSRDSKLRPAR